MKIVWKISALVLIVALAGCSLGTSKPPKVQTEAPTIAPTFASLADVTVVPKTNRPNFLFILTDDLDARMNTIQYMPNLQKLMVAQGLSLEDFLISTPVCCPSRSSILRGQYTQNHQVYTNADPLGGFGKFYSLHEETSTLATWLQAAGYRTAPVRMGNNPAQDAGPDKLP